MTPSSGVSNLYPLPARAIRSDRLESWKEIASYLRREVRTVQLWEKKEGLPVHRHFHTRLGSVYAYRDEIEKWADRASRKTGAAPIASGESPASDNPHQCAQLLIRVSRETTAGRVAQGIAESLMAQATSALERLGAGLVNLSWADAVDKDSKKGCHELILAWTSRETAAGPEVAATLLSPRNEMFASYSFPFHNEDSPACQREAAEQIAQCLWLKLISAPAASAAVSRSKGAASREAYLKGRYFWNQRSERGMRNAIRCFDSAIREDPQFAPAYSGLADSLSLLSFYEMVSPSEAMPAARHAALRALQLDPNLAEAHASLADILLHFDRDWLAADREYRQAIQCNPGYALGYHWYANLLSARGQHTAANAAIMQALEIDPVSLITRVWAGVTSHLAHRFDNAIRHYESALELDPDFAWAHMYMAQTLEQLGNFEAALEEFEIAFRLTGGNKCVRAMTAHAHAVAGDAASAYRVLEELRSTVPQAGMPTFDIAAAYAALGETDSMHYWLGRACEERNMKLFTLIQDPRFDPVRNSAAFRSIVDRTGLPQ